MSFARKGEPSPRAQAPILLSLLHPPHGSPSRLSMGRPQIIRIGGLEVYGGFRGKTATHNSELSFKCASLRQQRFQNTPRPTTFSHKVANVCGCATEPVKLTCGSFAAMCWDVGKVPRTIL